MYAQVATYVLDGLRPKKVKVDVYLNSGAAGITVAGVREPAVERLETALASALDRANFVFPDQERITVRMSSDGRRLRSTEGCELAIALAIILASGQLPIDRFRRTAFAARLGSMGTIEPICGALHIAEAVAEDPALDSIALANASAPVAACAAGVEVFGIHTLAALHYLASGEHARLRSGPRSLPAVPEPGAIGGFDFADFRGLQPARRAAEIAVAGDHSLLMVGPPECGFSFFARRIPSILPPLRRTEALEILRISSAWDPAARTGRPCWSLPSYTDLPRLIGSDSPSGIGLLTCAHHGVLHLEDVDALDPKILPAITTIRGAGEGYDKSSQRSLPASFFLLGTVSPTPESKGDTDPGDQLGPERHHRGLRTAAKSFDLLISCEPPSRAEPARSTEPSCAIRSRVVEARARQAERLGEGKTNRTMTATQTERSGLSPEVVDALNQALPYPHLAGLRISVAKVARTIADLAGAEVVDTFHMAEAIDLQPGRLP